MKTATLILIAACVIVSSASIGVAGLPGESSNERETRSSNVPKKKLRPFTSERELRRFFRNLRKKKEERGGTGMGNGAAPPVVASKSADADATVSVTAGAPAKSGTDNDESITNVQHAGVDEGGIVKAHGDHLVVLRRGRLFTISISDGSLKPVSEINAFGPDIDPNDTWYDEMLISGDVIAVIGYSYDRGGTEIGLFGIDHDGNLSYRATYHLRSNDYYSSRNYSSRLIGDKLIFYSPLYLDEGNLDDSFPALRKWHKDASDKEFRRIAPATRIYRSENLDMDQELALHTVTVCDLSSAEMSCKATAVIGPPGDVFYVSPTSVYVWASGWDDYEDEETAGKKKAPLQNHSILYRMPLDGSGPSALRVSGSPVDQFSFLEDEDRSLNVLVRSEGDGDGMWRAEITEGDVALLRVSSGAFSDGTSSARTSSYRALPKPDGDTLQNRFVGDYLLYGTGNGWESSTNTDSSKLYTVRWRDGRVRDIDLPHGVDRIEALGSNGIVVGSSGNDLHFTSIKLDERPNVADEYVLKDASQGELRSQGFFYKEESPEFGTLGLPVRGAGLPGYEHLFNDSASILFLRNQSLKLRTLGHLVSHPEGSADDGCRASCVDWYGNARPLFFHGRVFGLLGYEIVEGSLTDDGIRELQRVNFAPKK